MPREVSDDEYNFLQGRRQVADFVESIYNDPALSKDAKRLIKRKYPQLQIPDLDIEDKVDQRFEEEKKRRQDEDDARTRESNERSWKELRAKTQKDYGFTDEAMTDLEKMMVERNIGDYEVAASYKASKDPKPSQPDMAQFRWDHEKQPGFAEIAKDPEGFARNEIMRAIRSDQSKGER
jgi:hypothetical protein